MKLETSGQPILSPQAFRLRLVRYALLGLGMVMASLAVGVIGYHVTEDMPWVDALLNASMILGGMGPVDTLHTEAGKLFASFYALFAGAFFLLALGVFMTPIAHRLYHQFHVDPETLEPEKKRRKAK